MKNNDLNPEKVIADAVIFSKELNMEVVPKAMVDYAVSLFKLQSANEILAKELKEFDNISSQLEQLG